LKHVEFHFKNKFEKSVHRVGFIIRNLSRCMVTWTSKVSNNLQNRDWSCHWHIVLLFIANMGWL